MFTSLIEAFCSRGANRSVILEEMGGDLSVRVNDHSIHPPASLSKLLVAIAFVEAGIDPSAPVAANRLASSQFPSIINALGPNTSLTYGHLLAYSIATSDNPSAARLLQEVGRSHVYDIALGLELAYPYSPAGFEDSSFDEMHDERTTASDVALVMKHIHSNRTKRGYDMIWAAMLNNLRNARIPGELPDDIPVAHKTGTLRGVYHDAGFVRLPHRDLLLVVLTSGEPDEFATNREIALLAQAVNLLKIGDDNIVSEVN
jgi:beta-lactamase class A